MNRQKLVLFLLLVTLAGAIAYSFLRSPNQQVEVLKNQPGAAAVIRKKGAPAPRVAADTGAVRLDLLDQDRPGFSGFKRNIFSPIFRDDTPRPELKLPPPPPPVKLPPPPAPVPQQAMPAPPPPPTQEQLDEGELSKVVFLGFLKKDGEKTVFLSKNNEIFLAKKGSYVGPKFQVTDLTDEAITIKSVKTTGQLVIPLVENRSLSTRRTK